MRWAGNIGKERLQNWNLVCESEVESSRLKKRELSPYRKKQNTLPATEQSLVVELSSGVRIQDGNVARAQASPGRRAWPLLPRPRPQRQPLASPGPLPGGTLTSVCVHTQRHGCVVRGTLG